MKKPSGRIFNQTVALHRKRWANDSAGGRVGSDATGATLKASVQPLSGDRVPEHLRATGLTTYQVLFASDPQLMSDDRIELSSGTLLNVDAPAMDQAGWGAMWVVIATRID